MDIPWIARKAVHTDKSELTDHAFSNSYNCLSEWASNTIQIVVDANEKKGHRLLTRSAELYWNLRLVGKVTLRLRQHWHTWQIVLSLQYVRADVVGEFERVRAGLQLRIRRHACLRLPFAAPRTYAAPPYQIQVSSQHLCTLQYICYCPWLQPLKEPLLNKKLVTVSAAANWYSISGQVFGELSL